jgi:hypothetical protein
MGTEDDDPNMSGPAEQSATSTPSSRTSGKAVAIRVCVALLLAMLLFLPTLLRKREIARRMMSRSQLRSMASACVMYAYDQANRAYPDDPALLYPGYVPDTKVFRNPRFPDKAEAYVFVTGGLTQADEKCVLAFENVPDNEGRDVGYCYGFTAWEEAAAFKTKLDATKSVIESRGGTFRLVPVDWTKLGNAPPGR